MARPPRWKERKVDKGVYELNLASWKYFSDYINQEMLDYTVYIYRGHGDSTWILEPTLDRKIKSPTSPRREEHLNSFKYATRGRRGSNPAPLHDDDDWWALGQHNGLLTPLLDWTMSPFVALYFAASSNYKENAKHYSVFALSQLTIKRNNDKITTDKKIELINNRKPTVKIVKPLTDENNRLVNQSGLFTRSPNNMDIESWVKKFNQDSNEMELIKIIIPRSGIEDCLRYLNRMNINHLTLFPDLYGASEFCNKYLSLKNY